MEHCLVVDLFFVVVVVFVCLFVCLFFLVSRLFSLFCGTYEMETSIKFLNCKDQAN